MFLGHYAVGLAAKRLSPKVNLGFLTGAAVGLDLIWPLFVLAGWEWFSIRPGVTALNPLDFEHYPWSHSLVMAMGWAVLAALSAKTFLKTSPRDSAVLGGLVLSHWVLDWFVHVPDLPLWPGGPREGLGLWNHLGWSVGLEAFFFFSGLALYLRGTSGFSAKRGWILGTWSLFLVVIYAASVWGPVPPSPQPVAVSALVQWLLVAWSGWADDSTGRSESRFAVEEKD